MSKSVFIKILLLAVLVLVFACEKEVDQPSPAQEAQTVHYKATVQTGVDTRATIGEDMKYKFEEGDRVYMESTDGKLYGFLSLSVEGGQGKNVALFEGDLNYVGGTPIPDDYNPEMKLVLVSKEDELHTITDGKVDAVTSASYLANKWAPSLEDAVRHLSHFTGTGHFNDVRFRLNQQSGFLKCFVEMKPQHAGHVVTAKLLNDGQPFREAIVTVSETGSLPFVFAYLGGQVTLKSAKLVVEYNNTTLGSFDVSDKKLAANNSYSISRSTIEFDGFRIKAVYDNTTITFNYDGIEYSVDYGDTWIPYPSEKPQIPLQAEGVVFVKGNRTNYKNDSGKPIFTTGNSSQLCYISGNIMSLLKDKNNIVADAFRGAFSMGTTPINYIDINPDAPLILPATIASSCYYQMFRNCTSLTKAPELPATESAASCYYAMFEGCTSLVMPPSSIPFTTVAKSACSRMFYGCTSLTSAPEFSSSMEEVKESGCADMFNGCTKLVTQPSSLPATTLAKNCYMNMFRSCTSLTTAPDLPAEKSAESCYLNMFYGCTSLTTAPALPATESAASCYKSMFEGCTALATAPSSIPFETVEKSACYKMFSGCTKLTSAPEFPSLKEVKDAGCSDMFSGCTKLNTVPSSLPATTLGTSCYSQMFLGCTSLTAAPKLPATASAESCYKSMFEGCIALVTPPDSIRFTTVESSACSRMFYGCTSLKSAPGFSKSLTEVKESGCAEMFYNCTSLVTPPSSLPAGKLGFKAYYRMFYNCSRLESIPDFPHETGVEYVLTAGTSAENNQQDGLCYQMFYKCNKITSLEGKKLFNDVTPLKLGCFNDMFSTCAGLVTVPEDFLPATQLAPSCYRGMFQSCTNLKKAPNLLAETLEEQCYRYMFNSCTSLVYIKCYAKSSDTATSTPGYSTTQNWLQKAKNTDECEFHYRSGATWPEGDHGIPKNWKQFAE